MKQCPECAEQVQDAAKVCRFCSYRFDAAQENVPRCPRCTQAVAGDRATCSTCGLVLDPAHSSVSSQEANVAAERQRTWKTDAGNADQLARFEREHPGWMENWRGVDRSATRPLTKETEANTGSKVGGTIGVAAVIAIALWFTGSLDKPLANVGLNKNPCVQNAFGATFCGEDAKRMCDEFGGAACSELGYDSEGRLQRELEEEFDSLTP